MYVTRQTQNISSIKSTTILQNKVVAPFFDFLLANLVWLTVVPTMNPRSRFLLFYFNDFSKLSDLSFQDIIFHVKPKTFGVCLNSFI